MASLAGFEVQYEKGPFGLLVPRCVPTPHAGSHWPRRSALRPTASADYHIGRSEGGLWGRSRGASKTTGLPIPFLGQERPRWGASTSEVLPIHYQTLQRRVPASSRVITHGRLGNRRSVARGRTERRSGSLG